jgi:hypothetical protein
MTAELRRGRQRDNSVSQNPSLLQFSKENLMGQCIRVRGQAVGNRTCDLCSVYFTLGPVESSSCSAIPPPLFDGHIRGRETWKSCSYGAAYMGTRWYFIIASTASHGAPIFVVKKAIHLPVSLMVLRGYSEDTLNNSAWRNPFYLSLPKLGSESVEAIKRCGEALNASLLQYLR